MIQITNPIDGAIGPVGRDAVAAHSVIGKAFVVEINLHERFSFGRYVRAERIAGKPRRAVEAAVNKGGNFNRAHGRAEIPLRLNWESRQAERAIILAQGKSPRGI